MRALVIQLARLGDLLQTAPALMALQRHGGADRVDLLCPARLRALAARLPGVARVVAWDEPAWQALAQRGAVARAGEILRARIPRPYDLVWNLNDARRAIVLAHLLGRRVRGAGEHGPLSPQRPPWAAYLRQVAAVRGPNRVHLADAWCGLCGVWPLGLAPRLSVPAVPLPRALDRFVQHDAVRLAVLVGAGEADRRVPPPVWTALITGWLDACAAGRVVLVGSAGEQEAAWAIQTAVPSVLQGRLWNAVGQTALLPLAALLGRCAWVVGADTGPLHLGTAVGARALGWYVARARIHETGPYGDGHWAWQRDPTPSGPGGAGPPASPAAWPIAESVRLLLGEAVSGSRPGWSLYRSRLDRLGVSFGRPESGAEAEAETDAETDAEASRAQVWAALMAPGAAPRPPDARQEGCGQPPAAAVAGGLAGAR